MRTPHASALLFSLLLLSGCSLLPSYPPPASDAQRTGWAALREGLDQRDFDAEPLTPAERRLVVSIIEEWRAMPRIKWMHGRVAGLDGKPIPNAVMIEETTSGGPWHSKFHYKSVLLGEDASFNKNIRGSMRLSFWKSGYEATEMYPLPYWPGRVPKPATPLEEVLRDSEAVQRMDDLVLGRTFVLRRESEMTRLDRFLVQVPLDHGPPVVLFRYDWAERFDHQPDDTPLAERTAEFIHESKVYREPRLSIGHTRLNQAQWDRLEELPRENWAAELGTGLLVYAEVDELGRVARVESENHATFMRDAEGNKVKRLNDEGNPRAFMRPLVWPNRIHIVFLHEGDGAQRTQTIQPYIPNRIRPGKQMAHPPKTGYQREIIITHEDFEYWADQQGSEPAKIKNGAYYYLKLNGLYANMVVGYPWARGDDRRIAERGLSIHDALKTTLRLDVALQPNGSRNLYESMDQAGRFNY